MWSLAFLAVRAYWVSLLGSGIIVVVAAALLSATGVLLETGLRNGLPLLAAVTASFAGTAVLIVLLVVASTFASSLRPRLAQFALFRTIGAVKGQVRWMVSAEIILVFAFAVPVGAIPGLFGSKLFLPVLRDAGVLPAGTSIVISALPAVGASLLLMPTALGAGLLAARQVTRVSPSTAVRESTVERPTLPVGRRVTALMLLAGGLLVAGLPFLVQGTIGSAAGASSALLLIASTALGGPMIVSAVASRLARATSSSRNSVLALALVNARGFSRRLTTAVVPLALLLALGTVQTGVNNSVEEAAALQLKDGLRGDFVVTSAHGVTPDQAQAVASTPGVSAVTASSLLTAEVRSDNDDGALGWEQSTLRSVDGDITSTVDPQVVSGSLDELSNPGSIAASNDSLFGTGKSLGDSVDLRFHGTTTVRAKIVAIYDRGLGFGDYLISPSSLPDTARPSSADVLFIVGAVDLAPLGLHAVSASEWTDEARRAAGSQQQFGAMLLFVLLFFIAVAAANTLIMLTAARRPEFAQLRLMGATSSQLSGMLAIESAFVVLTALVVGTLAVLPALVAVSYGLLGELSLGVDWPVYGALAAVVVLVGAASMVRTRSSKGRRSLEQ